MAGEFQVEFAFEGEEYKLPTIMLAEFREIQKVTGFTVKQFWEAMAELDANAITALILIARKRSNPQLRFSDVDGDFSTFMVHEREDETENGDDEGKGQPNTSIDAGISNAAG